MPHLLLLLTNGLTLLGSSLNGGNVAKEISGVRFHARTLHKHGKWRNQLAPNPDGGSQALINLALTIGSTLFALIECRIVRNHRDALSAPCSFCLFGSLGTDGIHNCLVK